jgi:hypothetical protein
MSEIKPKKERRFIKTLGRVGEILVEQVLLKLGSSIIKKIGGKKTLPSILFLFLSLSLFAQFPNTLNKQRLGFQTTGDGLVWRGSISDTASIQPINNQNAWVILDTINLKFYTFDFTSNVWNLVGGAAFTQPVDSLFFNVNVPTNNVDTAKMRWDSDLATVVLGLNDNVPNEIGFKNFWLVKNQTGSTITKGSLVYANGTVGASGRITVDKFISNGSIDAKYLLGITAHDLTDGEDGYVISFGKIRQVNTDTFAAGAILYPSPTVAGVWTDVEPVAPNLDMPIGFCINSSSNNGTIAIRVASGYKLNELHDVSISSPVEKASLYYSGGLWRDTTAALLVSDTASMLANYATKEYADTTGRLYARQDFTNVSSSTLTWTQSDTLIPGGVNVVQVYRNGQILLPSQYTIPTSTSVIIATSSFKVNDNYTVIFPRGGGAGSGGGSGSLTSISGGTGILVSPNPITTTGTVSADLSVLMELTDTSLLNLTSRLATKLNISDTAAMLSNYNTRINSKLNILDTLSMLAPYFKDADTSLLNLNSRFALKLNAADTASLSNRIDAKGTGTVTSVATGYGLSGGTITATGTLLLDSAVVFSRIRDSIVDVAIGNDTIKILKQEYAPATISVLTWTITPKFPIQLKQYILVFRNGQLLINDQYNLTDTNKITIVSNSFKVGANYTVVTVSGIGSVGTGVFPNPVYPEAGIAVSTGSAWASSIANNSSNWNVAFNDKITNAQFTGTNTKTLTLTQYDGGTFAPTFTDLQGVTGVTAGTGLTGGTITTTGTVAVDFTTVAPLASPTFTGTVSGITKSMVGLGNVDNTSDANKPISTATQTALNLKVNISDTASMLTPYFRDADTSLLNLTSRFAAKLNLSDTLNMLVPYLRKADTTLMLSKYLRRADTSLLNLTSRFAAKLNISDTASMLTPYFRDADTSQLNLTSRFAAKQNTLSGTGFVKASSTSISYDNSTYLTTGTAASTYLPLTGGTLTGDLYAKYLNTFAKTTYIPFDVGIGENLTNISSAFRGGTIMVFPDSNLIGSSANVFLANKLFAGEYSTFGSGMRNYAHQGGDIRYNSLALYTSGSGSKNTNRLYINYNGDIGINDDTPSYKLDVNGTLGVTGAATLSSTLAVTGDITENGNNVLTSADTTSMLMPYLRKADTTSMLLPYFRDADTTSLNLTSRFAAKLNLADTIKLTTFGTSNAATLINKTLNIPNYKTLSVTDPLQDYLVKFSDNIGNGIQRSNISESGTTVNMSSSDVRLGAIKNNGTFSSPITISTNCGSSGSPNLIGTSTGNYVNNCSSGTAYILLPDPADVSGFTVGRILTITNLRSDQSIVLNTSGSYSNARPLGINSAAESSIAAKRWITVQSNGTNWYIISTGSAL